MKLGFYLGYAAPGTNPLELVALAQEAERLGFDSAWAAEAWGTDAVTVLSWLAASCTRASRHCRRFEAVPHSLHRRRYRRLNCSIKMASHFATSACEAIGVSYFSASPIAVMFVQQHLRCSPT